MDTPELKKLLCEALPAEKIDRLADELGIVIRQSKIRLVELVMALVLTARTSAGGRQADALRHYREATGQKQLARGAFYARFTSGLEKLLEELLSDAMYAAEAQPVLLPPPIATVKDWLIVDSTTVKLHDELLLEYPGTGDYAALKVHKTYSIGRHNMVNFQLSPARRHDANYCRLTEDLRGFGLLVDLGYAGHDFLLNCRRFGVSYVIRLKTGWKVNVESVVEGAVAADAFDAGPFDFASALEGKRLRFKDGRLDLDITLKIDGERFPARLVGLETPGKGVCVFLTNLPWHQYPADLVGQIYRLRWDIEKDNKLNKSDRDMDELDGRKPESVHTMLYASLLGSVIVNRIVHHDHQALFAQAPAARKRGPLHARLVALALAASHGALAEALVQPQKSSRAWSRASIVIDVDGRDPNWRSRPSVLDTLFGFTAPPGRPRRQKKIKNPTPVVGNDHSTVSN